MLVSIGEFKLKKLTLLPEFVRLSNKIHKQAKESKGNISSKLNNEGIKVFYSFTHWETKEDMLAFMHADHHGVALKETTRLCKEASFLHYETEVAVDIKIAKQQLKNSDETRVLKFE